MPIKLPSKQHKQDHTKVSVPSTCQAPYLQSLAEVTRNLQYNAKMENCSCSLHMSCCSEVTIDLRQRGWTFGDESFSNSFFLHATTVGENVVRVSCCASRATQASIDCLQTYNFKKVYI